LVHDALKNGKKRKEVKGKFQISTGHCQITDWEIGKATKA